jgi:hypothetical protein
MFSTRGFSTNEDKSKQSKVRAHKETIQHAYQHKLYLPFAVGKRSPGKRNGPREYRNVPKSQKWQIEMFNSHYGSDDVDLASMWYDLMTTTIPDAKLTTKEKSEKGFKAFMMAHHFLWTYPNNANLPASRFNISERYCRGEPLWRWIAKIAALKAKKIVWDPRLDANST